MLERTSASSVSSVCSKLTNVLGDLAVRFLGAGGASFAQRRRRPFDGRDCKSAGLLGCVGQKAVVVLTHIAKVRGDVGKGNGKGRRRGGREGAIVVMCECELGGPGTPAPFARSVTQPCACHDLKSCSRLIFLGDEELPVALQHHHDQSQF